MTTDSPQDLAAFALELADEARRVIKELIGPQVGVVSVKPDRSLVTSTDRAIEERLRAMINRRYPHHGIIGEEEGRERDGASHVWVLDPIDGTAAFIVGLPVWGTLIALARDGVPHTGVIDVPGADARWLGQAGTPTLMNGTPVSVRPCAEISAALLTNSNQDYMSETELPALYRLRARTANRVYGGVCLNYGRLAEGRTDLAMDAGQQVYDFAPYRPIVEGAGGVITDWSGRPLTLESNGRILAAGDARCHAQALEAISDLGL